MSEKVNARKRSSDKYFAMTAFNGACGMLSKYAEKSNCRI